MSSQVTEKNRRQQIIQLIQVWWLGRQVQKKDGGESAAFCV